MAQLFLIFMHDLIAAYSNWFMIIKYCTHIWPLFLYKTRNDSNIFHFIYEYQCLAILFYLSHELENILQTTRENKNVQSKHKQTFQCDQMLLK